MSEMQNQFEEWAKDGGYDLEILEANYVCYVNADTEIVWQAWKARKHELACMLADIELDARVSESLRVRYL